MLFLIVMGLIAALIVVSVRDPLKTPRVKAKIWQLNQQWVDYIADFHRSSKASDDKSVTRRMLDDLASQNMPAPTSTLAAEPAKAVPVSAELPKEPAVSTAAPQPEVTPVAAAAPQPADRSYAYAVILLYFGAFLLVASAGLFAVLGTFNGGVRTVVLAAVAALLFTVGFIIWDAKEKLRHAARTFVGISLALIPIVGFVAYDTFFTDSGLWVWLLTSLVAAAATVYSTKRMNSALLEYFFAGSLLSLFISGVAVSALPAYYYGWSIALLGIIIQAVHGLKNKTMPLAKPQVISAQVFVPMAVLVALAQLPGFGWLPLGVALLLAAASYLLLAFSVNEDLQPGYLAVAISSGLLGLATLIGNQAGDHFIAAATLIIASLPLLVALILRPSHRLAPVFAWTAIGASLLATLIVIASAEAVVVTSLVVATAGVVYWLATKHSSGYAIAGSALLFAAYAKSGTIACGYDSTRLLLVLLTVFFALQICLYFIVKRFSKLFSANWRITFRVIAVLTMTMAFGFAVWFSPTATALVGLVLAIGLTLMAIFDNALFWSVVGAVLLPLLIWGAVNDARLAVVILAVAILWNEWISRRFGGFYNQIVSVFLFLIAPLLVANLFKQVPADFYTVAYAIVTVTLFAFRARAKRLERPSSTAKTPLSGAAYAVGYTTTGLITLLLSTPSQWRWLPAAIGVLLALIVWLASRWVEQKAWLMTLVPLLIQIGLWSTYRGSLVVYASISFVIAAVGYGLYLTRERPNPTSRGYYLQFVSLVTMFLPAIIYLLSSERTWVLPIATVLAGLALSHYVWHRGLISRELAGLTVLTGILMTANYYEVSNIHYYSHLIAIWLAGYAFSRTYAKHKQAATLYWLAALAVITLPLVIQVLFGSASSFYGWLLLLEQILIMLLGMLWSNRLLVYWGLAVAIGSVLYQLRDLGWATLGLIAILVISLGLFRLYKSTRAEDVEKPS